MAETLTITFVACNDGTYEVRLKEGWAGKPVCGQFIPPYTNRQVGALQKKLNTLETPDHELRVIGQRLFQALCGADPRKRIHAHGASRACGLDVQSALRNVIQRTLKRRGT